MFIQCKMSPKEVLVFLLTISVGCAQIPSLGYCPDYHPKANFDIDQFLGKWYEAEKYFTFSEIGGRCVVTDYARAPSGKIYMSNEVTNSVTGIKRIIEGSITSSGKSTDGKLVVKYGSIPIANEQTLVVLDTDYDNFAVIWSCNRIGLVHTQNVWVMTRDRLPSGPTLQKAYGVLDKFKISRTFFVKTDQEGCALAASDLNAINGITGISTVPEALGQEQKNKMEERPKHSFSEDLDIQQEKLNIKIEETSKDDTTIVIKKPVNIELSVNGDKESINIRE